MAIELSIIIPGDELLVEPNFYELYGREENIQEGNDGNLWSTVIYELWYEEDIYFDLLQRVKVLKEKIEYADFSDRTANILDKEKNLIIEGLSILKKTGFRGYSWLLHDLKLLLDTAQRYVEKRVRITKTVYLVEKLDCRIRQLHVDVQTGDRKEINIFKKEMKDIEDDIKFLKNFGANQLELKRLTSLADSANLEIMEMERM